MELSLQEQFAPDCICFGCGHANERGLRIRSFLRDDGELVCEWSAEPHHQSFPGILNGGIIGSLFDCHCNWAAAIHRMQAAGHSTPPVTVTAEFTVKMRRPTPVNAPVTLTARVVEEVARKITVTSELRVGGRVTATASGVFVEVAASHPARHGGSA